MSERNTRYIHIYPHKYTYSHTLNTRGEFGNAKQSGEADDVKINVSQGCKFSLAVCVSGVAVQHPLDVGVERGPY